MYVSLCILQIANKWRILQGMLLGTCAPPCCKEGIMAAETSNLQVSVSEQKMLPSLASNFLAYPAVPMPITLGKITLI